MSDGDTLEISCNELKELLEGPEGDSCVLLDVRQRWEYETARISGSILLGDMELEALLPNLQEARHVVTICHHGIRSYTAAAALRERGVPHTRSLSGGVEEWAKRIDPSLPRY